MRRGTSWESAKRLAAQAALAENGYGAVNGQPFGHGVSVTSEEANLLLARDPEDAVLATVEEIQQAGFEVRYTPTTKDSDHHTIQLPKPVTEDVAAGFNAAFGRIK